MQPTPSRPQQAESHFIEQALNRYLATREESDFEMLVKHYARIVRTVARRVHLRHPTASLERDDLRSAGMIALIESIRTFDPNRNNQFISYAWRNINRAMLDELKRYSWRRKDAETLERITAPLRSDFVQEHGFAATPEELHELLLAHPRYSVKAFGHAPFYPQWELIGGGVNTPARRNVKPLDVMIRAEVYPLIDATLNRRERAMLHRFFDRQESMPQIASALGVHKATVVKHFGVMARRLRHDQPLMKRLGIDRYNPDQAAKKFQNFTLPTPTRGTRKVG